MDKRKKVILTSFGLNTSMGRELIGKELCKDTEIGKKRIFVFHEPHWHLENMFINACLQMGFPRENIILSGQQDSNEELMEMEYLYITEGNVFEIKGLLMDRQLDLAIQKAFRKGKCECFIGASAGAMLAGVSIREALDREPNEVGLEEKDMRGLGLVNGLILPHYTKSEAKMYIKNTPGIEKKYNKIYSVADEKSLILEV